MNATPTSNTVCFSTTDALDVPHDGPDPVLVLNVIEHAQLPRHRDRHVQQATFFGGTFESETGAKRRHVVSLVISFHSKVGRFAHPNTHG